MEREEFSFTVDEPDRTPPRQGPVLTVRLFESAPAFENQEFIYRLSALRWQTDYYHVFAQPPATLLTFQVRRWMVHSGLFRSVAIPGLGPAEAWQLQGFVTQLYGDFSNPDLPEAVLHLRCALLAPGAAMEAVFTKTYRQHVPLRVNTPEGLVEAWNQALQGILSELTADVARALRHPPSPPRPPPAPPPSQEAPAKNPFSLFPALFQRQPNLADPKPEDSGTSQP